MRILPLFLTLASVGMVMNGCAPTTQPPEQSQSPEQTQPLEHAQSLEPSEMDSYKTKVSEVPNEKITTETIPPKKKQIPPKAKTQSVPKQKMIDVPIINQNPELKNGCEVTSLAMLLQYAGHKVDKVTLAKQVKKDTEKLIHKGNDIKQWGNPNHGFVGDMTGKTKGFAVYNKPLEELMRRYMGERTVNLTGKSFDSLIQSVGRGKPVLVWTTGDFTLPTEWASWYDDGKKVVAPFDEHVVLIVGYDEKHVYVNDPLSGKKQGRVSRNAMKKSWEALGKQALSYQ